MEYHKISRRSVIKNGAIAAAVFSVSPPHLFAGQKDETYRVMDVKNGGGITGVIKIKGKIPKDPLLDVEADAEYCCGKGAAKKIAAEQYVISAAGEIKNAAAMIEGIQEGNGWKNQTAFIDNLKCRNEPRVIIAPLGGTMTYKNSDPINHTAHYYLVEDPLKTGKKDRKKDLINQPLPKQGMIARHKKPLRKEGLVSVECDPHPFEQAWIWVLPHPYGAVSDEKGKFKIENVPAGTHKLKVWHEKLGQQLIEVSVKTGESAHVIVEFKES